MQRGFVFRLCVLFVIRPQIFSPSFLCEIDMFLIGNTSDGGDGTVTLTIRLANDAQPVAYNFRTGGDDATYPGRAFSSWTLYGSANGTDWDVCDTVTDLPAKAENNKEYNGTIQSGANKGNFPIAMLTDEARGALSLVRGSLPGQDVPQVTRTRRSTRPASR